MRFRIDLENHSAALHFGSDALHFRSSHAARSTPRRPNVDEHGSARAGDDFVERVGISIDRLIDRLNRCFATSAATFVGEMSRWDSVLLSAGGALSNHRTLQPNYETQRPRDTVTFD